MNIALSAFFITLLLLPSLAFRFSINKESDFRELLSSITITDSFWYFSLISLTCHLALLSTIKLLNFTINYQLIFDIINAKKEIAINNSTFQTDILCYIIYNLMSFALGYLAGITALYSERKNKFLTNYLGIENNWYELLDGNNQDIDFVYLNILTETKERTVIYSGFLKEYYFKPKSSELSSIVIENVTRKDLRTNEIIDKTNQNKEIKNFSNTTGDDTDIKGLYFVIPAEKILNINIQYLSAEITQQE